MAEIAISDRAAPSHGTVPRGALVGAGILVAVTIGLSLGGRLTGIGVSTARLAPAVEVSDLHFTDRPDGGVAITRASDGRLVDTLAPNTNAFVRITLRSLARERRRELVGAEPPFRLSRLADGKLTLTDPATRHVIELDAFGQPNAGAFASILAAAKQD